jgi:hypothetical protein
VDWVEATNRLLACGVTLNDIAQQAGLKHDTVRRTRLDPASKSYRRPPENWRVILAAVAKRRSLQLTDCAADLLTLAREVKAK